MAGIVARALGAEARDVYILNFALSDNRGNYKALASDERYDAAGNILFGDYATFAGFTPTSLQVAGAAVHMRHMGRAFNDPEPGTPGWPDSALRCSQTSLPLSELSDTH